MKKYTYLSIMIMSIFFVFSCGKNETEVNSAGSYQGILYTKTYSSFTGITTYDTVANNFVLEIRKNENGIVLNSSDPRLDDVNLREEKVVDTINVHYGNDKFFLNEYSDKHDRVYYLYLNKTNDNDSIYMYSYPPPQGGWNSKLIFDGLRK